MTTNDKRKFIRINSLNLSYVLVDGEGDVVDIKGHVVHAGKNKNGKYELGIELLDPDDAAREILKKFIKAFRQQHGPAA
jgi:hypothetical protein